MDFKIDKLREENDVLTFQMQGLNVSFANSIRRTILSDIPTIVFKTMPYSENKCTIYENTTKLNNEILKQRLSCIPIHISDLSISIDDYLLELNIENDSDEIKIVTTKDFKIKNKQTEKYLSDQDTKKIFPPFVGPSNSHEYYIEFVKLLPKISETIPGSKIHLDCKFSISTSRDDSMFNVVSTCSYGNTIDQEKIDIVLNEKIASWKKEGKSKDEITFEVNNFKALEAKRLFIPDCFSFVIQSLGVFENKYLVKQACSIIEAKAVKFLDELQNNEIKIEDAVSTIKNCFDIALVDEYYELGTILNHLLYTNYYSSEENLLSFVGFKKMHPHDDAATLRIAFTTDQHGHNTIIQIIEQVIKIIVNTFQKIKKLF